MSRLQWRCRRGTRELDELLQGYLRESYPTATRAEQEAFEQLLELPDPLLQDYFTGHSEPDQPELRHVIARILAIRSRRS